MDIHELKHYISFYFPEFTYYVYNAEISFEDVPPIGDAYNVGNKIILDNKLKKRSTQYVANVVIHELLHMLLHHNERIKNIKNPDPMKWNIACDIIVNNIMEKHGIKLSGDFITIKNNPNLVTNTAIPIDFMTAEEVYDYVIYDNKNDFNIHGQVEILTKPNIEIKERKELPLELQHLRDTADKIRVTWSRLNRFNDDIQGKIVKSYKKVIVSVDVSSSMDKKIVNIILHSLKGKRKVKLILWNNNVVYDGEPKMLIDNTQGTTDPIKMLKYYREKHYTEPLYIVSDLQFTENTLKQIVEYLPEHCKVIVVPQEDKVTVKKAREVISKVCEVVNLE